LQVITCKRMLPQKKSALNRLQKIALRRVTTDKERMLPGLKKRSLAEGLLLEAITSLSLL